METENTDNLIKNETGADENLLRNINLNDKIENLFLPIFKTLENNALNKKEEIRELKKELHKVDQLIISFSEEIKDYQREKEVKEKEATIKHSKSELNTKLTSKPSVPIKDIKKTEVNGRSKTPIKTSSKPEERSKTPVQEKSKITKQENKTPVRERPARESNKSPINNKSSKSPIVVKSKNDVKTTQSTLNIKTIDKKDKKSEEKTGILKKESTTASKTKSEKVDKKSVKSDDKSSVTTEKNDDTAIRKPQEIKPLETVPIQEKPITFNYPKKEKSPDDSFLQSFDSNLTKSLILTFKLNLLPLQTAKMLLIKSKSLYSVFPQLKGFLIKNIIKEKEKQYKSYSEVMKKYDNDSVLECLSNKNFTPTKTAISSLNFIQKEEEANMLKNTHPDQVYNVLKLILIMLGEDYQSIPPNKYPEKIYNELFPKFKVESLKTLIMNVILKSMEFSKSQIEAMIKTVDGNPKLLVSSELLKLNKVVSYASFILKEIYEFQTAKSPDGEYLYLIRDVKKNYTEILQKIEELKKIL